MGAPLPFRHRISSSHCSAQQHLQSDFVSSPSQLMGSYKSMGESGWTYYIQDDHSNFSSDFESPSLVSDAGTSKKKLAKGAKGRNVGGSTPHMVGNQNGYKQRDNFDLEDTASSPITSPKELPRQNHPFSYQHSAVNMKKKTGRHY